MSAPPATTDALPSAKGFDRHAIAQRDRRALGTRIHALHIGLTAQQLDRHDLQKVLHVIRQLAEPVMQFGGEGIQIVLFRKIGETAVKPQAHLQV